MTSVHGKEVFEKMLKLVGKDVEVAASGKDGILKGTVTNAMFDSFILDEKGQNNIISYADIVFINEIDA